MKIRNKKLLTKSIAMAIFMSSTLYTMPITHAAFNNNTLPSVDRVVAGQVDVKNPANITQGSENAVIQWKDFSVGANATVNFKGPENFNTLNYVNSGNLSQIYGTINATDTKGNTTGNIYIVNPAGVQIGNSAQINVGSLYVSNKNLDTPLKNIDNENLDINNILKKGTTSPNAELMSLGNINATNVTFDGNRIVLDVDRVKNGQTPLGADNITIKTTQTDFNNKDVVLGYTAYDDRVDDNSKKIGYKYTTDKNNSSTSLAKLILENNTTKDITKKDGFMWVKDGEQLQAMNTNLGGNYAFRNSIDLNATADNTVTFNSVGLNSTDGKGFTGNLDGLGYEVYGLYINEPGKDTGLFAKTYGATIRNFNLISGSIISTEDNAGAVVGNANDTVIENVKNTINVTGANNVGGIIGTGTNVTLNGVVNSGAIKGNSNVGGLAGSLVGDNGKQSFLTGESYNLGDIKGLDTTTGTSTTTKYSSNIGGLVGLASNSTIGNETGFQMYNHLDVEGGYNVGGIVGNLKDGSTVQNVSNDGNVNATGYITGYYNYHTNNKNIVSTADRDNAKLSENEVKVNVANVGGIVGNSNSNKKIDNVLNNGDVSTNTASNSNLEYYIAGNVGGIVGSAVNTDISNATNKENDVRGAHNVGGIAGYFGNTDNIASDTKYTIKNAINNGGDIMATGARNGNALVKELIRNDTGIGSNENFIVGNIGGIVGYMYGDSAYINTSANRGTVHTEDIADKNNVLDTSKAANVGGIVGKIDRSKTKDIDTIKGDNSLAAINSSYNTGNVRGYTGVGGVAGMMYNGEIVGSYNIGEIRSTRKDVGQLEPLNMGGIVGDSTEQTSAKISLYDVYNKGQIGDEEFVYKGRHVGGIAGRLSGDVEKSYNDGDIYNGANVTGGIAGWWVKGNIRNSFNTGNVTNYSTTSSANGSNVGGIAGGMGIYQGKTEIDHLTLENVYNLGTIRSIKGKGGADSTLGGMIGVLGGAGSDGRISINNVYTLGNLYADQNTYFHSIIGRKYNSTKVEIKNAYYITPGSTVFKDLSVSGDENNKDGLGHTTTVSYSNKNNENSYTGLTFINQSNNENKIDTSDNNFSDTWRIYGGSTTPILNAFLPETNGKFDGENSALTSGSIDSVQYGTAYDPLLTIINTKNNSDITLNWQKLGIYGDAGLAVYSDKNGNGGGLTLNNFVNSDKGVGLFGGIIYSDGALNIKSYGEDKKTAENIGLGSFSKLYGSSVTIDAGTTGTVDSYGSIISTGNNNIKGDITITGASVNTYGEIKTAVDGQTTTIYGIGSTVDKNYNNKFKVEDVENQNAEMPDVAEGYAYTTKNEANSNGDISISATNGDVNIYYGNMEKGIIDTQGNVTLVGNNVYVDSDMIIGGKLKIKASTNGIYQDQKNGLLENINNDGEILVDISNIGKVQNPNSANEKLHGFLHSFDKGTDNAFIFIGNEDNIKITADMWKNDAYNLSKYDTSDHKLAEELTNLDVRINTEDKSKQEINGARDITYIWVADGEQLKGIQTLAGTNSNVLNYNFALKNDINATDVTDYKAIGSGNTAFTGNFDGRGNRIIGLNVSSSSSNDNVGVFGVNKGTIKNLKVYSSTFKGYDNVGAIAGTNNGTIDNVTTLGNTVEALGSKSSAELDGTLVNSKDNVNVGAAGGVVGTNTGTVNNATSRDSVIAGENTPSTTILTTAGGIVGINTGLVSNSQSHSAVTASEDSTYSLGGIVGVNTAKDSDSTDNKITAGLDNVNAYGVTSGIYSETGNKAYATSSNIGGIAGVNSGTLHDAYNESIVKGLNNIGGIAGINSGEISLIVNGASVTAEKNVNITDSGSFVGGLVGSTTGDISDGRNNGVITGVNYVGGLVGSNGSGVTLEDLTNDSSAEIIGEKYVGGIAGENNGNISTTDTTDSKGTNLINRGSITGQNYVGGIAGKNNGTIKNVNNDIVLNVKDEGKTAEYFGGVTGINKGTITNATNSGNINASGATYVGGIAGENNGKLEDFNGNYGNVTGGDKVGGAVGKNTVGIDDAKLVNTGKVTSNGGAGGIFAENSGKITNSDLSNSGTVIGGSKDSNSGTGGLIGINSGDIEKTSLRNEVNGNVTGTNNVGGLIGINSGVIIGEKGEGYHGLNYYKYQIYNNGTIKATGNGSNIGGLIGYNKNDKTTDKIGSLTAGYNTGNIDAGGSTNVGGIVGTNEGTVDQVFNTIAGNGSVEGNINVGGLIGTNSGTLSNAYSTSAVKGNSNIGNAVGTNSGKIDAIYSILTDGKLISFNNGVVTNAYTYSEEDDDTITNYLSEGQRESLDFYIGFDKSVWKGYEGKATPLLKEFLTETKFENGQLVAADNWNAFNNTNGNGSNNLFNQSDIPGSLKYWSYQINTGSGKNSPNNLGYDLPDGLVAYPIKPIDPSEPEKPDREYNWSHIYQEQWDRNRDFKERKAEFNFVDGAIPLDEAVEEV